MRLTIGPLISVIIPAYNVESYIVNTVQSVLNQTYQSIEIIIVNDGSTDKTGKIIDEFRNSKIHVIHQPNKGASAARNKGYRESKGIFIKFLDGDDQISPEMVEQQLNLAIENDNSIISAKWGRFYQNDISTFEPNPEKCWQTMRSIDWIRTSWENTASMTTPGIFLIPRSVIVKSGDWDETLSLMDDTEYFTRIILAAEKVVFSEYSTLFYNSGLSGNLSALINRKGLISAFSAIEKTTSLILNAKDDHHSQLICANIWQLFIYRSYPDNPDLISRANDHILKLKTPSITFPCGGFSKLILPIVGWKLLKKLQSIKKSFDR